MTTPGDDERWMGHVPAHWSVSRLGSHFTERRVTISVDDFEPLSVTMQGIVPQLANAAKSDATDNRKLVRAGDFVINSRSDRKGSGGVASQDGSVSQISIVLEPMGLNSRFTHYLLTSYPFQEEFYRWGAGIVADLWSTRFSSMKQIKLPVPPLDEQKTIADFLDHELAQIDALIAKQEQTVSCLIERRKSFITRCVTQGRDPSVATKQSGVEWLGEIPALWSVMRLKYLGTSQIGMTYSPENVVGEGEGTLVLRSGNVQAGKIDLSDCVYVDMEIPNSKRLKIGDVLICARNGSRDLIGKNAVIDESLAGSTYGAFMTVFRSPLAKYVSWVLSSSIFDYQLGAFSTSTINQLTEGALGDLQIPVPPSDEIEQIMQTIEAEVTAIDTLMHSAKSVIQLMRERRRSLISAAVTGKIDVRKVA